MRYVGLLILASACGWSERRFEAKGIAQLCEAAASCAQTYDASTCIDRLRSTDRSSCDFDPDKAAACSADAKDAPCETIGVFAIEALRIPESCIQTYDCDWIDLDPL